MGEQLIGYAVECATCGRTKCPRGRSAPMGSYMCDYDCEGYYEPPLVGDLWPRETAEDFGYPLPPHPGEPLGAATNRDEEAK